MAEVETIEFRTQTGAPFNVALGAILVDTPSTLLRQAERVGYRSGLPMRMVVKLGRKAQDFGRLDLEQLACERLGCEGLSQYWGASRTKELGTALAFELLEPNPLLLLNTPSKRPVFRDPQTFYYPLPPGIALELASDVLYALEHVHARGFVHGGVTLTNLLVRTPEAPGGGGVLGRVAAGSYQGVLAGLGGARELSFLEALRQGQVDLELTPRLPPLVAPPESVLEIAEHGGRRVYSQAMDSYAFGLLFYTLLTGRRPFDHIVEPETLTNAEVIAELKLQESRGDVSPVDFSALQRIALHDSPLFGSPQDDWPVFHAGIRHLIKGCVTLDPSARMTVTQARALFKTELRLHRGAEGDFRSYVQRTFQLLPGYNRLQGDKPVRGGLWVREENETLIVEETARRSTQSKSTNAEQSVEDFGATVSFRTSEEPAAPQRQRRIDTPLPLRDLLRTLDTEKPLEVGGPYLLTSIELDRESIEASRVYALGTASSWVSVGAAGKVEEKTTLLIGRASTCDIVLADAHVSKQHAELSFDRNSVNWAIKDLRSANGTEVGADELTGGRRQRLRKSGTTIVFGTSATLTYIERPDLISLLRTILRSDLDVKQAEAKAEEARKEADVESVEADGFSDRSATTESEDLDAGVETDGKPNPSDDVEFVESAPEDNTYAYVDKEGDDVSFAPDLDATMAVGPDPDTRASGKPRTSPSAPTRKLRRPGRGKPEFPIAKRDAARAVLAKKLGPFFETNAKIFIILKGGGEGHARDLENALDILVAHGQSVLRVEAEHQGKRKVVFSRGR